MFRAALTFFLRRDKRLNPTDIELMGLLRAAPNSVLSGHDLMVAKRLASEGLLSSPDGRRYVLTERGLTTYLGKH